MSDVLALRPVKRYCAFLDILGFEARLIELESLPASDDRIERLISCLNFMDQEVFEPAYSADLPVYSEENGLLIERELGDLQLTYVSDCMIISAEHTANGFKALCRKLSKIWCDLAWDGFFCRGGIAQGPLVHQGAIVFGSAYLRALKLEKLADMPRVIVDDDVVADLGGFPSNFPMLPPTIDKAADGRIYLRYFPYLLSPPYAGMWDNYLLGVRRHIVAQLSTTDPCIRPKYIFLRDEWNFAVTKYHDLCDQPMPLIT